MNIYGNDDKVTLTADNEDDRKLLRALFVTALDGGEVRVHPEGDPECVVSRFGIGKKVPPAEPKITWGERLTSPRWLLTFFRGLMGAI